MIGRAVMAAVGMWAGILFGVYLSVIPEIATADDHGILLGFLDTRKEFEAEPGASFRSINVRIFDVSEEIEVSLIRFDLQPFRVGNLSDMKSRPEGAGGVFCYERLAREVPFDEADTIRWRNRGPCVADEVRDAISFKERWAVADIQNVSMKAQESVTPVFFVRLAGAFDAVVYWRDVWPIGGTLDASCFGCFVSDSDSGDGRLARLRQRSPNKKYTKCAQYHSYESGTSSEKCADRRSFLSSKVLFIAAIIAFFIGCLGYAVRLGFNGEYEAAIYFWGVGVAGIFGTVLLGIPIVFDLF
jgi:hypothetical protein